MTAHILAALILGATVVPQTTEQLTDLSSHVVRAKVTAQASAREEGPAGIYTRSTLQILETLKGAGLGPTVSLRQAGGTIGTERVDLPGDAKLEPGEEVLAFLFCRPGRNYCTLVGLAQGKYHLEASADGTVTARRSFAHTAFVGGPKPSEAPEPCAPLAARVRARAGGRK